MSDAKSRQCVGDIWLEVVYRLQVVVGLTLTRLVCTVQITTTMYYTLTIRLRSEWYTMQSCLEDRYMYHIAHVSVCTLYN